MTCILDSNLVILPPCAQCTGILKAVANCYSLIDASKAFDTVDHYVLFKKLLTRGIPIPIARFLLHGIIVSWSVFVGMTLTLLSFLLAMVSVRRCAQPNVYLLCALYKSGRGSYCDTVY